MSSPVLTQADFERLVCETDEFVPIGWEKQLIASHAALLAENERLRAALNEWAQVAAQACEDDDGGFTVVALCCSAYARLVEQTANALKETP